jgi:hypothetical protein
LIGETIVAINRPVIPRLEGNLALFAAGGADSVMHLALPAAASVSVLAQIAA